MPTIAGPGLHIWGESSVSFLLAWLQVQGDPEGRRGSFLGATWKPELARVLTGDTEGPLEAHSVHRGSCPSSSHYSGRGHGSPSW